MTVGVEAGTEIPVDVFVCFTGDSVSVCQTVAVSPDATAGYTVTWTVLVMREWIVDGGESPLIQLVVALTSV